MTASLGPLAEFEVRREVAADAGEIVLDLLGVRSLRASSLKDGSPIIEVPPPISAIGRWPVCLQPVQHHDLDQRAGMQAFGGCVEADIGAHRFLGEKLVEAGIIRSLVDETALAHRAQEIGFEGGHMFFPESTRPLRLGRGMHERGRLAPARDQQKWNPVLRWIARQTKGFARSAKVESGFASAWMTSATIRRMLASSFPLA